MLRNVVEDYQRNIPQILWRHSHSLYGLFLRASDWLGQRAFLIRLVPYLESQVLDSVIFKANTPSKESLGGIQLSITITK